MLFEKKDQEQQTNVTERQDTARHEEHPETAQAKERESADRSGRYDYTNGYQGMPGGQTFNAYHSEDSQEKQKRKKGSMKKKLAVAAAVVLLAGAFSGGVYVAPRINGLLSGTATQTASDNATESAAKPAAESPATAPEAETLLSEQDSSAARSISTTTSSSTDIVVTDVTQIVENVMPSMVAIDNNYTAIGQSFWGQRYSQEATASGSGIIIGQSDSELLIATNNHVVEDADSLKVQFIDETKADAEIKGTDPDMDLAVIAVKIDDLDEDTLRQIRVATLGDSDALRLGEPVVAIGNALGYGQSVTNGIVSALDREIEMEEGVSGTFIQTNAAINPGNSGGALLNSRGEVIGINSNKIGGSVVEGMGYAIPISKAQPIIDKLMNLETKHKVNEEDKGYFGITVMTPTGVEGAYVSEVQEDGAADLGGIEAGDIITRLNGTDIKSRESLTNELRYYEAGDTVSVTVLRKGSNGYHELELEVTLQSAKESGISSEKTTSQEQPEQSPRGDSNPFSGFGFGGY